ncbi:MAG TPA: sigma-54 dependent transcriptional regulator, partial [Bacteroidota bacterium]|nr:sigma-54 dependent transcriptional regulator [Bacteroidota bacterium]
KQGYNMPVIIMTAFSDIKMAVRAMKLGAEDFLVKPLDLDQLEVTIERALKNFELRKRVDLLSEQIEREQPTNIIGVSEGLKKALELAKLIASTEDTTVLISGETGTGKELIARYIHDNSPRANGPFVSINCGAIPKELAENEFFGYERGAFTGAIEKMRPGKFEQAQHGTILLDEISELSLDLQVKLLRVLQERRFYRLGGTKEISVDVRVIASTNRDLAKLVGEGKFREDLFYRLNVANIVLPPLRDRGEDILLLARAFLEEFNKKFRKKIVGFNPEAQMILMSYPWKGNIRELRNALERVCLLTSSEIISAEDLSFLSGYTPVNISQDNAQKEIYLQPGTHFLKVSSTGAKYNDVTKDLIEQVLKIANGNQIKAAKILNISRAKLRYRIEQLGINLAQKQ